MYHGNFIRINNGLKLEQATCRSLAGVKKWIKPAPIREIRSEVYNRLSPMALDEKIYELRRDKIKQIEALGQPAYPSKYEFTHTIPQILDAYTEKTGEQLEKPRVPVRVAGTDHGHPPDGQGRIRPPPAIGKATPDLRQERRGRREGIRALQAAGSRRPHRGQRIFIPHPYQRISIHVEEITFLSKDLLPLPEKWHGLTDVELRYRQRYVDLVMNPEVREVFLKRSQTDPVDAAISRRATVSSKLKRR